MKRFSSIFIFIVLLTTFSYGSGSQDESLFSLEVGYMPILPDAQIFVIESAGWALDKGLKLDMVKFQNGPAMVQALAAGDLDVAYFGIGPAMVSRSKGVDIKVVASNIVEQIAFIALEDTAAVWDPDNPARLFGDFTEQKGRKLKIATFPAGSVPDTVLRYWLVKQLGVSVDDVEILPMGNDQVQQALLSGSVDAAAILEPVLTIVLEKEPSAQVLARAPEMFPGQPGAVVAVREQLIAEHPEVVQTLVDLHINATDYLNTDPGAAAELITPFIGQGLISPQTIENAIISQSTNFVADPRPIVEPSNRMQQFQVEIGSLAAPLDLNELFDFQFFQ